MDLCRWMHIDLRNAYIHTYLGEQRGTGDPHQEDGDDPSQELLDEEAPVDTLVVGLQQPHAYDGAHDALGAAGGEAPLHAATGRMGSVGPRGGLTSGGERGERSGKWYGGRRGFGQDEGWSKVERGERSGKLYGGRRGFGQEEGWSKVKGREGGK